MTDDHTLLRRYADFGDADAFAELVRRHLDGVYSIALRRVGRDAHLARDVAQGVFVALAREASRVAVHPVLIGWLYTTTRYIAANTVRRERRRQRREQEAEAMHAALSKGPPEADWNQLAPVLEAVVDELREADRVAVLLRFVERRTFAEIGEALRLTEDAARRRVDRALEKLRAAFARRGVVSSASALAGTLTAHAVGPAPAGLEAAITGPALATAAAGGPAMTLLTFMATTKFHAGVVALLLATAGIGFVATRSSSVPTSATPAPTATVPAAISNAPRIAALNRAPVSTPGASLAHSATPLRPAEQWSNRGRATPEDALETVFQSVWGFDYSTLGKAVVFAPADLARIEAVFARVPENVRTAMQLTNAADLFALVWTMEHSERATHPAIGESTPQGPDEVDQRFQTQQGSSSLRFRRSPDGWQWVVPTTTIDRLEAEFHRVQPGPRLPAWANKLVTDLRGAEP